MVALGSTNDRINRSLMALRIFAGTTYGVAGTGLQQHEGVVGASFFGCSAGASSWQQQQTAGFVGATGADADSARTTGTQQHQPNGIMMSRLHRCTTIPRVTRLIPPSSAFAKAKSRALRFGKKISSRPLDLGHVTGRMMVKGEVRCDRA
jgi:hypothetical protein